MSVFSFYKPPFRGLTAVLMAYFLLCFAVHPQSAIMHQRFMDPDDAMYALQSNELLEGQGWYDRTEHRMNPSGSGAEDGTPFHYTRIMELPYAATLALLKPLFDLQAAIFVMAAIWPPVFLILMLLILQKETRLFLPKKWVGISAFMTMTAQGVIFDFMPGHIDHHGFISAVVALSFLCLLLMIASPGKYRYPMAAGVAMAFGLSLGLEVLPWLLAFSTYTGIWASLGSRRPLAAVIYAAAMLGTATLLLPTYRLDFFTLDPTAFSFTYIVLLFGILACFGVLWALRNIKDRAMRMTMGAIFAALAGLGFLSAFPELLEGPYGAVDARLMQFMLPNIKEAISLYDRINAVAIFGSFLPFPLIALGVCLWQVWHAKYRARDIWLFIAFVHVLGLTLALFYQSRYTSYAQLFGIVPLSWLLYRLTRRAKPWQSILYASIPVLAAALPFVTIFNMPIENAIMFPMMSYEPGCDISVAAKALNAPPYDSGPKRLIINTADQGPDILLHTRHAMLAASYHEDVSGNLDALDFFRAPNAQTAAEVVRKRHADLILMCTNVDRGYVIDPDHPDYALPHPFILSLIKNELPPWLEPITLNAPSQIQVYKVLPEYLP